jgi:hypothetical protein
LIDCTIRIIIHLYTHSISRSLTMMARTRKRDDDSAQYNSDATSLAALDASSMSATGSRSSLTFASSNSKNNNTIGNGSGNGTNAQRRRPRKRQRKSLTDALQSISLDKDKGVPEQILKMQNQRLDFPFSSNSNIRSSVGFTIDTNNPTGTDGINNCNNNSIINTINGTPFFGGAYTGMLHSNFNNLNSKQQLNRKIDRENGVAGGDGDVYYDDDNSQLTSSTEDEHEIDGMEDEYDDSEEIDDEEDCQCKKLALMTDLEKAQRKVMLELVFGKDHQESRKVVGNTTTSTDTKNNASSLSIREVGPPIRVVPPIRIEPVIPAFSSSLSSSPPPPFATISTTTTTMAATKPIITKPTAGVPKSTTEQDEDDCKDPADRKIEELLRLSLKNLREGTHPLRLPPKKENNDDDGLTINVSTPWKTQDDMAIDPEVYSPRVVANQNRSHPPPPTTTTTTTATTLMSVDGDSNHLTTKAAPNTNIHHLAAAAPPPVVSAGGTQARQFGRRPRSNSLPGGLEMTDTTTAMDMDG